MTTTKMMMVVMMKDYENSARRKDKVEKFTPPSRSMMLRFQPFFDQLVIDMCMSA